MTFDFSTRMDTIRSESLLHAGMSPLNAGITSLICFIPHAKVIPRTEVRRLPMWWRSPFFLYFPNRSDGNHIEFYGNYCSVNSKWTNPTQLRSHNARRVVGLLLNLVPFNVPFTMEIFHWVLTVPGKLIASRTRYIYFCEMRAGGGPWLLRISSGLWPHEICFFFSADSRLSRI